MGQKTDQKPVLEISVPTVFKSAKPERILIIKLGALGDMIQAFGLFRAIREHHPHARITLLTTKPYETLVEVCPYIDEVQIDTRPKFKDIMHWVKLHNWLNEKEFKCVYDLQNTDRTRLYQALIHGKNKPDWYGLSKTEKQAEKAQHAFKRDCTILKKANIKNATPDNLSWLEASVALYSLRTPYVLLVPGCAPSRPEKRWPAEYYGRLAQFLNADGLQPVIIGTDAEEDAAQIITKTCPEALNLTGQTNFAEIAELGRNAAAAVGNDTGPMHIIGATNCPSLVLFSGISDPKQHKPLGEHVNTLQTKTLDTLKPEKIFRHIKPRFHTKQRKGAIH